MLNPPLLNISTSKEDQLPFTVLAINNNIGHTAADNLPTSMLSSPLSSAQQL